MPAGRRHDDILIPSVPNGGNSWSMQLRGLSSGAMSPNEGIKSPSGHSGRLIDGGKQSPAKPRRSVGRLRPQRSKGSTTSTVDEMTSSNLDSRPESREIVEDPITSVSFQWRVHNFWKVRTLIEGSLSSHKDLSGSGPLAPVDDTLKSEEFGDELHRWHLEVLPFGSESSRGNISVFVQPVTKLAACTSCLLEVVVVDCEGEPVESTKISATIPALDADCEFPFARVGFPRYIKAADRPDTLKTFIQNALDGQFALSISLFWRRGTTTSPTTSQLEDGVHVKVNDVVPVEVDGTQRIFLHSLRAFLESAPFMDITFKVDDGKELRANSFLLSSQSQMVGRAIRERPDNRRFHMEATGYETMAVFLEYCHCGTCGYMEERLSHSDDIMKKSQYVVRGMELRSLAESLQSSSCMEALRSCWALQATVLYPIVEEVSSQLQNVGSKKNKVEFATILAELRRHL